MGVLDFALTRAKNELIVTRQSYSTWAETSSTSSVDGVPDVVSTYFLNAVPERLFDEIIHKQDQLTQSDIAPLIKDPAIVGIVIG